MRIFCICYDDLGAYGGSTRQVIEISRQLERRGHELTLCAPSISRLAESPFRVIYIPVINFGPLRYLSYLLLSPLYMIGSFFSFRPQVVLYFQSYLDMGPLLACSLFRCHFVFYINGIAEEELRLEKMPQGIIRLVESVQGVYARLSALVFTMTDTAKQYLSKKHKLNPEKIKIVKNGVDTELFKPLNRDTACESLSLNKDHLYVGFVGGLYSWHGLDYLIEAVPLVAKEVPQARFMIIGKGKMERPLRERIKALNLNEKVIFTGAVSFDRVPIYINAFDVCVVFFKPVRSDPGDPIKLYEYLACAKPVVASKVAGYGDFVESAGAGFGVDAANPGLLARILINLLRDEALRYKMGERGLAAVGRHTWEVRAQKIEAYLQACCKCYEGTRS